MDKDQYVFFFFSFAYWIKYMILISTHDWKRESSQGNAYSFMKTPQKERERKRKNCIKNQIELVEWEWKKWIKA